MYICICQFNELVYVYFSLYINPMYWNLSVSLFTPEEGLSKSPNRGDTFSTLQSDSGRESRSRSEREFSCSSVGCLFTDSPTPFCSFDIYNPSKTGRLYKPLHSFSTVSGLTSGDKKDVGSSGSFINLTICHSIGIQGPLTLKFILMYVILVKMVST